MLVRSTIWRETWHPSSEMFDLRCRDWCVCFLQERNRLIARRCSTGSPGHIDASHDRRLYRDDSELIQACLNKSEAAWNELVVRYARLVYSIPLRNGLSLSDSEDVFQNVFTIVWRNLATLRDQKLLAAWLIRITYRECTRVREHLQEHDEIPESLPSADLPAEDEVEILEKQHLVRLAMSQLEPRCQELLQALFVEMPSPNYQTLAERLGMAVGSIGPTRARCLKKLEEIFDAMGVDFGD